MSEEENKQPSKKAAKKTKKIQISDENETVVEQKPVAKKTAPKKKTIAVTDFADEPDETIDNTVIENENQDVEAKLDDAVTDEPNEDSSEETATESSEEVVEDTAEESTEELVPDGAEESDISEEVDIDLSVDTEEESAVSDTTEEGSEVSETIEEPEQVVDEEGTGELQHEVEELAEPEDQMADEAEKTIEEAMREAKLKDEERIYASNPEVDKAVDEIVRAEGDTDIEVQDSKLVIKPEKLSKRQKIKRFFVAWWSNHLARYATIVVLLIGLIATTLIPVARYAVLNTIGVRVQASMTIVDDQTRLPLKNISVNLQGDYQMTDEEGMVSFSGLKLGSSNLIITKRGYAQINTDVVLGWGSNPLGAKGIVATGEQYKFALTDWLTKEPVTNNAEAVAGENSASADESGVITLTIGEDNLSEVEIVLSADNYRNESFTIADLDEEVTNVTMVSARKHAFISNRDGRYDLYAIDLDGKNEEILVQATEKERDVPALLHHPTRNITGFVSSRSGITNSDGFKLDEFYIVNTETGEIDRIARSEQLRLIGWVDDTVLFSQVVEGTSAGNPERSKIFSYNERTKERVELATANYFNDVELIGDTLYYAVSSFAVPQSKAKLYSVPAKGGDSEIVLDSQVWNLFRVAYDTVQVSAIDQKWYELIDGSIDPIDIQPAPISRKFIDSPSGNLSAWVEIRDGKGTVLTTDVNTGEEQVVFATPGLSELLYWINDTTLIYRITSSSETADYVLPIVTGGDQITPIKIRDVTANQRYYY